MQVIEKQQTGFVVYSIVLHCKYKEFAVYLQIFFNVFDEKISNSGADTGEGLLWILIIKNKQIDLFRPKLQQPVVVFNQDYESGHNSCLPWAIAFLVFFAYST